jgi:hypothetical protein
VEQFLGQGYALCRLRVHQAETTPARAINPSVEAAPTIAPQWTERQFDWRDRTRPNCQDINDIEQDPARGPKALRAVVAKIFYTRLRGAFVFHGMSSIKLSR